MNKSFLLTLPCALLALAGRAQSSSTVTINEVCASNIDQWVDLSFNYGGWAELYNPTSSAINVQGWYLSDDPAQSKKAKINQSTLIPAHGWKTVWFDHYHWRYSPKTIDLKLDTDGGTLYLANAAGQVQSQVEYPEAVARCSWARTTDGSNVWMYAVTPSPGKSNDGMQFAKERLAAPKVSSDSRFFASGTMSLNVTIPDSCTLRYTTDGSTPTLSNGYTSTSGNFSGVTATRLYRFRLFRNGFLPSPVVTRTLIHESYDIDLPILSILGTQKNFYGDSLGIFTKGVNGRAGLGQNSKCNWNMDWERPAEFQYFTAQGEQLLAQEVGLERCGGWSRAWQPWSFKIKANKQYEDKNTLLYDFFAEKPRLKHKTLQIRGGGNDNSCRVRDAVLTQIVATSGLDVDYQAYQPVAHFVNGVWKGTINMREPNNKHYVYANYGLDDDEIDQFEMSSDSGYVQKCGDKARWKELITLSKTASTEASYQRIGQMLDLDEFCNYFAVEFYLGNWDWPQNNVKAFAPRQEDGRFRFVLFDLDNAFTNDNVFDLFARKASYTFDWLYDQNRNITQQIELVSLFHNLLNNNTFRKKFIDTYCLVAYSVFEPTRCREITNQIASRVAHTQALYNNQSPWGTANDVISKLSATRQNTMLNQLKNHTRFRLSSSTPKSFNLSTDCAEAQLMINDMPVPTHSFKGSLFLPVTVEAKPVAGYRFMGWKELASSSSILIYSTTQQWKYYDLGALSGKAWTQPDYADDSWKSGLAPLGYYTDGNRSYKTTLNYGTDRNNKRPTYYFRTEVTLDNSPSTQDLFTLNYTVDDGIVVYVNGQEAGRYNMPSGTITYSTYASTYANGNPDTGTMKLDANLFTMGRNVIAVELHNNSGSSTDVYWSASLQYQRTIGSTLVNTSPRYEVPSSGNANLIASYEPLAVRSGAPVVINEISADNGIYLNDYGKKSDWIELYNTTDQEIDLAGMLLTDKVSTPDKWTITADGSQASTLIAPHGYLLIWCDKNESKAELHAPFKLDNDEGKQVMLTAADGSWSDTLTYCRHLPTETCGRYPDAASDVYLLTRPTQERANRFNSYCATIEQAHAPAAIEQLLDDSIWADPYLLYDLHGRLIIRGEGSLSVSLTPGAYIVRNKAGVFKVLVP